MKLVGRIYVNKESEGDEMRERKGKREGEKAGKGGKGEGKRAS